MARKRSKTSAYTRERNRILRYIRSQRKQGKNIELYIPTELELRKTGAVGQEITARVRDLKKLKPAKLQEYATPIFSESKSYTNNESDFTYENQYKEDSSWIDRVTISMWKGTLNTFENGEGYEILSAWINTLIAENGEHAVAEMLREGSANGLILTWDVVYKTGQTREYISAMMSYLPEQGILYQDEIMDRIDIAMNLSDYFESQEDWELPK